MALADEATTATGKIPLDAAISNGYYLFTAEGNGHNEGRQKMDSKTQKQLMALAMDLKANGFDRAAAEIVFTVQHFSNADNFKAFADRLYDTLTKG